MNEQSENSGILPEEYNSENILLHMQEESFGIHISLISSGIDEETGREKMRVNVESNLHPQIIKDIFCKLADVFEEESNE